MVFYHKPTLADFMSSYPKGLASLLKIKNTFRTVTGRKYGPQFIDMGIAIGEELFEVIQAEYNLK